jgi:hypothetical protein
MSFYMDLSHIGIHWKAIVDQETLDDPVSNCSVPYTDFTSFIMKYILKCVKNHSNHSANKQYFI